MFQSLRDMDEIMVANFMICDEVIAAGNYDLVIGDESWEHRLPPSREPRPQEDSAFVWMTDFVGYLPMPDRGDREAFVRGRLQRGDDPPRSSAIGQIRDKVDLRRQPRRHRAGPVRSRPAVHPRMDRGSLRLRRVRDWLRSRRVGDRDELRAEFGYHHDER